MFRVKALALGLLQQDQKQALLIIQPLNHSNLSGLVAKGNPGENTVLSGYGELVFACSFETEPEDIAQAGLIAHL